MGTDLESTAEPSTTPASILSSQQRQLPWMSDLFAFSGPDPWRYDCTEDFFSDQLGSLSDMSDAHFAGLDLSRPLATSTIVRGERPEMVSTL